jgi:serine/threonine-protein kinase RsbW
MHKSAQSFPANLEMLASIRSFVEDASRALGVDPAVIPNVIQAVDESATNIVMHGYRGQPGSIDVDVWREENVLAIQLRDHAPLFDPTTVPPPDLNLPLELRPIGGLGIYLVRKCMDEVAYRVTPEGYNELTLLKKNVSFNHR